MHARFRASGAPANSRVTSPFDRPPWYFVDFALAIEDRRLADIYRHWDALRGADVLPPADRFDPLDLVPHLGDLFIVRVEPGSSGVEPVLRYTLVGTRLVEALGRDATGKVVGETFPADHPVNDVYRRLLKARVPVRTHGRLDWVGKDYRSFESILLPLAGPAGEVVKVVGAAVYRSCVGPVVRDGAGA